MIIILIFFLGASIGSFIGLVCDRYPEQSIVAPRSHCTSCQHQLQLYELIPILSQLWLGFKCHHCNSTIPKHYMVIECLCGLLLISPLFGLLTVTQSLFLVFSLCLSFYDHESLSFPLSIWALGTLPFILASNYHFLFPLLLMLALVSYFRQLPIGEGDFLYAATASLLLPVQSLLISIELACLTGLLSIALQKNTAKPIPFIPFLTVGVGVVLFFYP